jgi:ubiquinone/menaquinone biosynthesis C-methylase UbiE
MLSQPGFRKKFFAWMLRKGDSVNDMLYRRLKTALFKDISGIVVEIGPGTGINFNYLPENIQWIGLEPNTAFYAQMLEKAKLHGINARLINSVAEKIELPDESADVVISTLVLCSVKNISVVMQEIKRVLKKNGKLIFIEHVAAPRKTTRRKMQQVLNPVNRFIADGCNCNRETWTDIEKAGFSSILLHHEMIKDAMALHAPHIVGYAVK